MNRVRASLGALSPTQMSRANQTIDALTQRLAVQNGVLRQAASTGVDTAALREQHAALLAQLQRLADTVPALSTDAFEEWLARAAGVEAQITALERHVRANLPGAAHARNMKIAGFAVLAVAGAAGVAALIWYGTKGRT